jgi:carbonic anhydrase/acetyltransferase-like protein (isoleucine patch superfamily)
MIYSLEEVRVHADSDDYYVAPDATLIGNIHLGHRSSIWFKAVLRGDNDPIRVGNGSNVQDGSVLHTDVGSPLEIGENVTIGHMVMLHGCTIGDGSLVGIGAIVLNNAVIGRNSLVGAGSLVPEGKSYPDGVLILGTPARVVRDLRPEEIATLAESAEIYRKNARRFADGLNPADVISP